MSEPVKEVIEPVVEKVVEVVKSVVPTPTPKVDVVEPKAEGPKGTNWGPIVLVAALAVAFIVYKQVTKKEE